MSIHVTLTTDRRAGHYVTVAEATEYPGAEGTGNLVNAAIRDLLGNMAEERTLYHEGVCIDDPFMDETGRVPVDPETYYVSGVDDQRTEAPNPIKHSIITIYFDEKIENINRSLGRIESRQENGYMIPVDIEAELEYMALNAKAVLDEARKELERFFENRPYIDPRQGAGRFDICQVCERPKTEDHAEWCDPR